VRIFALEAMSKKLTEQEILQAAEHMHKRHGRSVQFYQDFLREDAWEESDLRIKESLALGRIKPVKVIAIAHA